MTEYITVSDDFRILTVPASCRVLGAKGDADVRRLHFKVPSTVTGTDLSGFSATVHYVSALGTEDVYTVEDKAVEDGYITFSWLVGRVACEQEGETEVSLKLRSYAQDGETVEAEFNSGIWAGRVLDSNDSSEAVVEEVSDALHELTVMVEEAVADANDATAAANAADAATDRAEAAAEACEDISELAVPLMSTTVRGGAMLGDGLVVEDGALEVDMEYVKRKLLLSNGTLTFPWTTRASQSAAEVSYDMRMDHVHTCSAELEDGSYLPRVRLFQSHWALPFDTQFSPAQAWLYAIDGLPAGPYSVTLAAETNGVAAGTYYFELSQAVPAGGQVCGFISGSAKADIKTYPSRTSTVAVETVAASDITTTAISGAVDLGTFPTANLAYVVPASGVPATAKSIEIDGTTYTYHGLNYASRCRYGNNRWLHSPLRQYLNSRGFDWWEPATVFDRPPAYAGRIGFLSGLPEDFLAQVRPIARKTALNYITDGGTSAVPEYDTTYDYFTLPSGIEHNLADTASYGGGQGEEGEQWEYWQGVAGSSSALAWSTWNNVSTYHPEYVQYDMSAHAAARHVWMRSAHRGYGYNVAIVNSSGTCINYYALYGHRAAPACAIC